MYSDYKLNILVGECLRLRADYAKRQESWPLASDFEKVVYWSNVDRKGNAVIALISSFLLGGFAWYLYKQYEWLNPGTVIFGAISLVALITSLCDLFSSHPNMPILGLKGTQLFHFPDGQQIMVDDISEFTVIGSGMNECLLIQHSKGTLSVPSSELSTSTIQIIELVKRLKAN